MNIEKIQYLSSFGLAPRKKNIIGLTVSQKKIENSKLCQKLFNQLPIMLTYNHTRNFELFRNKKLFSGKYKNSENFINGIECVRKCEIRKGKLNTF